MDPIQALLLQANKTTNPFAPNSRYHTVDVTVFSKVDGEEIVHLKRRFVPSADTLRTLQQHQVKKGEKLDNITFQYLNDPELFWQVCDANETMHPLELTEESDRLIRITLPKGL